MNEPTVQVPVSLIERAPHERKCASFSWNGVGWDNDPAACDCWKAEALSQPTPSTAPPRIEDMAPGTTFTAEMRGGPDSPLEWVVTPYGSVAVRLWTPGFNDRIDPSTIRDVTPPTDG